MGSDGQACASCHYHAGADNREKNEQNQGANGVFDLTATGGQGPNETLGANDFPFHQLVDPDDRESFVLFDTDDVTSSQRDLRGQFQRHHSRVCNRRLYRDCIGPGRFPCQWDQCASCARKKCTHGDQRGVQPAQFLGRPRE